MCWIRLTSGDIDAAQADLLDLLDRIMDRGEDNMAPAILLVLAELEHRAGRWDVAERHAIEGDRFAHKTGWEPMRPWSLACRARILAGYGRLNEARKAASESLSIMESAGQLMDALVFPSPTLGFIELSAADPNSVKRVLTSVSSGCAAMGLREPGHLRFVPDLVEALVQLGDPVGAAAVLEPFEERSQWLDRAFGLALSARCRGLIRAASGDLDGAQAAMEEAVTLHDRVGEPFELGRTLLVKGETEKRAKRWRQARVSLRRAADIFEELGAVRWAERTQTGLRGMPGRAPGPRSLTSAEERVVGMVAEGMSNPEIAGALFIAPKSVEARLTRIYRKLGIASRPELVRWLKDRRHPSEQVE